MKNLLVLLTTLIIMSCSLTPEVIVDDQDFKHEYVDPFIAQAQSYGSYITYTPLKIIYTDHIAGGLSGYANMLEGSITFDVTHEYWNSPAKEAMIYHELAHIYLSKVHIDEQCSCDVPFSIMSMWSKEASPAQYNYWVSGEWLNNKEYYMRELFMGTRAWHEYPGHENVISHDIESPCDI